MEFRLLVVGLLRRKEERRGRRREGGGKKHHHNNDPENDVFWSHWHSVALNAEQSFLLALSNKKYHLEGRLTRSTQKALWPS